MGSHPKVIYIIARYKVRPYITQTVQRRMQLRHLLKVFFLEKKETGYFLFFNARKELSHRLSGNLRWLLKGDPVCD